MKKRTTLRCAAANDDDFATADEPPKPAAQAAAKVESSAAEPPKKRKKEKEFAWMDSDDEDDDEDEAGKSDDGKKGGDSADTVQVDARALDAAETFGAMVRLAEDLQLKLKLGKMQLVDIAATYRAIARTKFFDGELLEILNSEMCKLLAESKTPDQIASLAADAIDCLSNMNAYDKHVFSAIAQFFGPRIMSLDPSMGKRWLQSFRRFEHTAEKDFLQMLEATPMAPGHPGYKTIRCRHDADGSCALGAALCTFSHDPRALPSLEVADAALQRPASIMLTHGQLHQGRGAYTNTPSYSK